MEIAKTNIANALNSFTDYWNPRIIGELNGQQVKIAKLKGEFVFHHHDHEDELFYVLKGTMKMVLKDKTIILQPGEMIVIPKGVEHKPVADEEVHLLLFEPAGTLNTGNLENELTRRHIEKI